MGSFSHVTFHIIPRGWLSKVELDGQDMQHIYGNKKCVQNFGRKTSKETTWESRCRWEDIIKMGLTKIGHMMRRGGKGKVVPVF
jgi:hypothetical protein